MDPPVHHTSAIQTFLTTPSADLYFYIDQLFQFSTISNYLTLISAQKFNRQAIDIYIQSVTNRITKYPMMFKLDHGGTTQKKLYNRLPG